MNVSLQSEWDALRAEVAAIKAAGRVRIEQKGRRLHVVVPYHDNFRKGAKELAGIYRERTGIWTFSANSQRLVKALAVEVFGEEALTI